MGIRRTMMSKAAGVAATKAAPMAGPLVGRQLLSRSIDGFPGFPGAREVARKQLERTRDVEGAVKGVLDQHVRLAGAQGFVANLGGVAAIFVTIPANIAGLGLLLVRQAAAVAHLRGHDLNDPRVQLAVFMASLGKDEVDSAIDKHLLPGRPSEVANGVGPVADDLFERISKLAVTHLTGRVTGKRAALVVTRRIPIVGGGVGGAIDAVTVYNFGKYASAEFAPKVSVEIDEAGPVDDR